MSEKLPTFTCNCRINFAVTLKPLTSLLDGGLVLTRKLLNLLVKFKSSLRKLHGSHQSLRNICVTNDHKYAPLVVSNTRPFPHSWLITGFATRITRRVPLVEQELLILPEHLISPRFSVGFVLLDFKILCSVFISLFVLLSLFCCMELFVFHVTVILNLMA